MAFAPEHFVVEKPFRFYRKAGTSLSNTWVGRSQAFETVYEVLNSKPGDVLYDLPGGYFMAETDGTVSPVALAHPTPLFEKNYGIDPDVAALRQLGKDQFVRQIEKPETEIDFAEVRERCDKRFPPLHKQLLVLEASPQLQTYRRDVKPLFETWCDTVAPTQDFDTFRQPTVGSILEDDRDNQARLTWRFLPDNFTLTAVAGRIDILEPLYDRKSFSAEDLENVLNGNFEYGSPSP